MLAGGLSRATQGCKDGTAAEAADSVDVSDLAQQLSIQVSNAASCDRFGLLLFGSDDVGALCKLMWLHVLLMQPVNHCAMRVVQHVVQTSCPDDSFKHVLTKLTDHLITHPTTLTDLL